MTKKRKIMAGTVSFILALTLCLYVFSPTVSAIINKNGSITLHIIVSLLLFAAGWLLFNSGKIDEEPV